MSHCGWSVLCSDKVVGYPNIGGGEGGKKGSFWGSEMAKNRKNTIQNAKKVIKMSPVTVFTQSLGYNVIFCVFEKGANNILFSIPPYPQKDPQKTPRGYPIPVFCAPTM